MDKELRIDEQLHMRGLTFLHRIRVEAPEKPHWKSAKFRKLAKHCSAGNADAMWVLGNYFVSLGTQPFYECAANFWRYRAYQKRHAEAEQWFLQWVADHPGKTMPSVMPETISGYFSGKTLNALGFLFFDPRRSYSISQADSDDVVEVSSWSSTEDADSDGFGMEECYDWWYLDENLNALPGTGYIHDFSRLDKQNNAEKFQKLHGAVVAAIKNR